MVWPVMSDGIRWGELHPSKLQVQCRGPCLDSDVLVTPGAP